MQADAHRHHAESLERTVTLAQQDPSTSVGIIESTWAAAYHWLCYGCIKRHRQHRDKHQGLAAYFDSLGERTAAQWWRELEDLRLAGFYGNKAGSKEVQKALDLLALVRAWANA